MKTLTITLNENELNVVLAGLSELPFKVSQPMIVKFMQDFNEQNKPAEVQEAKAEVVE
jgi:hypothetical protein